MSEHWSTPHTFNNQPNNNETAYKIICMCYLPYNSQQSLCKSKIAYKINDIKITQKKKKMSKKEYLVDYSSQFYNDAIDVHGRLCKQWPLCMRKRYAKVGEFAIRLYRLQTKWIHCKWLLHEQWSFICISSRNGHSIY